MIFLLNFLSSVLSLKLSPLCIFSSSKKLQSVTQSMCMVPVLLSYQIINFDAMLLDLISLKFAMVIKLIQLVLKINVSRCNVNLMDHSNSFLVLDANKCVINEIIHYNYTNSLCVSYNIKINSQL